MFFVSHIFQIACYIRNLPQRNGENHQIKNCRETQLRKADVFFLRLVCKTTTKQIPLHLIFFKKQMCEKKSVFLVYKPARLVVLTHNALLT